MIEKIKYYFRQIVSSKKVRISCLAILSALSITLVTLLGNSIYTVKVFDGIKTYTVHTLNNSVTGTISGLSLDSYSIDRTTVRGRTTSVKISYNFPVYVTCGDKTTTVEFNKGNVRDAIELAGYTIDEFDSAYPEFDSQVTETTYIDFTNVDYVNGSYTEKIPFSNQKVYSSTHDKGYSEKLNEGIDGERQVSYTEKLINGVSVEKSITAYTVVKDPVNSKTVIGVKEAPVTISGNVKTISVIRPEPDIALDANGNPVNYKNKMVCRATAYTYTGYNCSTGVAPKPGYIAVNPKVIPYGTKLYIKSADGSVIYGYAIAADTGGFIKKHPTGIDLFLSSESACRSFGVRPMEVYILE